MLSIEDYFKVETGTVFILGNGPSLNNYDLSLLNKDRCMTMNRSWDKVPGARWHINCMDITSVRRTPQNILFLGTEDAVGAAILRRIKCPVVLIQVSTTQPKHLRSKKRKLHVPSELDLRNGCPNTHTGLLALRCAYWLGYDTAVLLGYDGCGTHYDDSKMRMDLHASQIKQYKNFAKQLVSRLRVYNCLADNKYEVHPYIDYGAALESWR